MGKKKMFAMPRVIPTVEEYVRMRVYDPYDEPLGVTLEGNTVILINSDKWKIVMNSDEGSFIFSGRTEGYYEIDRIRDIWSKQGDIYTIRNLQEIREERLHKYSDTK